MKAIKFLVLLVFCSGCYSLTSLTIERKWMPIGNGKRGIIYDSVTTGGLMAPSHNDLRAYDVEFSKPVPPETTPDEAMADLQNLAPLQTTVATQEGVVNKVIGAVVGPAAAGGVYGYFAVQTAKALRPDVTNVNTTTQQLTDVDVSQKNIQKNQQLTDVDVSTKPRSHYDSGY